MMRERHDAETMTGAHVCPEETSVISDERKPLTASDRKTNNTLKTIL